MHYRRVYLSIKSGCKPPILRLQHSNHLRSLNTEHVRMSLFSKLARGTPVLVNFMLENGPLNPIVNSGEQSSLTNRTSNITVVQK